MLEFLFPPGALIGSIPSRPLAARTTSPNPHGSSSADKETLPMLTGIGYTPSISGGFGRTDKKIHEPSHATETSESSGQGVV